MARLRLLPRHLLRSFFTWLTKIVYQVKAMNHELVPAEGGVLMISNHVSYVDAFILSVASPRHVRFVIVDHFLEVRAFGWFLRLFDVIPISPSRAKDAIRTTADALKNGDLVCIFPEGQLTRTGMLNELKKGFELIVRQAKCPVLPVYMDSLWGSIFSFDRFRYFYKVPRRFPYPVTVNFGQPVSHEEITGARARALIQDLSVEAFAQRDDLRTSLGAAAIRSLRQHGKTDLFVDLGQNLRVLTHRDILVTSLTIAEYWRDTLSPEQRRLGILLPPGSMPALFHLAAHFAGRVPVHLPLSFLQNSTLRDEFLSDHGISTVITSRALLGTEELPPGWMDMRQSFRGLGFGRKLRARLSQRFLPSFLTIRRLGLHQVDRDEEAVGYVDESTGKLVSLSHLNVLASAYQIDSSLIVLPRDRILVDDTLASSPALTFGLWYPLFKKNTAVYRGLSARKLDPALILQDQRPEVVLLSQDLRAALAKSEAPLPDSIRIFIDFSACDSDSDLTERLESSGAVHCIGFAPPGLGAIVSMNTKDPNSMIPSHLPQTGKMPGTVGRLMPGLSARTLGSEDEALDLWDLGRLALRGSSIPGEPTLEVDGFRHHPLKRAGQFDRQGFLTLDGSGDDGSPPEDGA